MSNLNEQCHLDVHDLTALHRCALVDLTDLARVGFRGTHSADYLQGRGFKLPASPNQALVQSDGGCVARLSQTEYFLLGSLRDQGKRIADEEAHWTLDGQANYLLPRHDSHGWLQLSGEHITEVMAKLCGVDLRPQAFKPGNVAQTSAARINVIVMNVGTANLTCLQILFDRASLNYFTDAMLDAMEEFDGRLLDIEALLP